MKTDRRRFCGSLGKVAAVAVAPSSALSLGAAGAPFRFRWIVASSMYGKLKLAEILPELPKLGAKAIDIWPLSHGDQREQIEKIGHEAFAGLLKKHGVELGILTHYDLGPFGLREEMDVARKFGAKLLVCGGKGPRGLKGDELGQAVKAFVEKMKPHVAAARERGVAIAIENHGSNLIESPDSLKWLAEFSPSRSLGVALAPYHLEQDSALIAALIRSLGDRLLHFYAWQHGMGCMKKLPKEQELLQMPGRGKLDFRPIVAALREADYRGWTGVFMHPVPRGIPILPTAAEVTKEIARAQEYLTSCLR